MSYTQAFQKEANAKDELRVKILSQFKVYYDDYAESLSAENTTGPFDVLKGHANFITLLKKGEVTVRPLQGEKEVVQVERGIVRVAQDNVEVFLDV